MHFQKINKAFTLVELLVTVAIIGILSAMAISNFNQYRQQANDAVVKSQIHDASIALNAYKIDNPEVELVNNLGFFESLFEVSANGDFTGIGMFSALDMATALPGFSHSPGVSLLGGGISDVDIYGTHCNGTKTIAYPDWSTTYYIQNGQMQSGNIENNGRWIQYSMNIDCSGF